jgi:hypothetical protein
MIRNYFKFAWRNLFKTKSVFLINIGGLAVGMAVATGAPHLKINPACDRKNSIRAGRMKDITGSST